MREIYAAVLADGLEAKRAQEKASRAQLISALALAEQQSGTHLQTAEFAGAFGAALKELWTTEHQPAERSSLILNALFKGQTLASRIGDDSNLALDPDLDTYYLQNIVVRKLPTFVARLAELQEFFATSLATGKSSAVRDVHQNFHVDTVTVVPTPTTTTLTVTSPVEYGAAPT